jgi:hypothetical protein
MPSWNTCVDPCMSQVWRSPAGVGWLQVREVGEVSTLPADEVKYPCDLKNCGIVTQAAPGPHPGACDCLHSRKVERKLSARVRSGRRPLMKEFRLGAQYAKLV